jgi:hypothetical protein
MAATLRTRSRRSSRQTAWHRRDGRVALIQSLVVTNEVLVSRPCHSLIWGIACLGRWAAPGSSSATCSGSSPKIYLPANAEPEHFCGSSGRHGQRQSSAHSERGPPLADNPRHWHVGASSLDARPVGGAEDMALTIEQPGIPSAFGALCYQHLPQGCSPSHQLRFFSQYNDGATLEHAQRTRVSVCAFAEPMRFIPSEDQWCIGPAFLPSASSWSEIRRRQVSDRNGNQP